jgi:hypothetical protein
MMNRVEITSIGNYRVAVAGNVLDCFHFYRRVYALNGRC